MVTPHYISLPNLFDPTQSRKLAYYEWGDAHNPRVVMCVHGLSRNGRDFDFLAQALAPHYRVICPDMAGRGKSDWLADKAGYTVATYITDILTLLQKLSLEKVLWVGTSMGGILGMMLAASQPQCITAMVLNDIGAIVSAKGLKRILSYVGSSAGFANATDAMAHLKSVIAPFGISTDAEWQHMFTASFDALPDGRYAFAYDPAINQPFKDASTQNGEIVDIDLSMVWSAVTCPVLIVRGGDSDILTHATAERMCVRAAPTTLVEFAGVGHAPALLNEKQIRTVIDWLDIHAVTRNA